MALVTYPKGRDKATTLHIGPHPVRFTRRTMEGTGEVVMAAELSEGPVLDACRRNSMFRVYSGTLPPDPPAAIVPLEAVALRPEKALPSMVTKALGNGWTYADITDTGTKNDWSRAGGISDTSGLCMSEMALCSPPEGWDDEKRAKQWPWETLGWRPPFPAWEKPSTLRKKRAGLDEPPPLTEEPAPLPVLPPPPALPASPAEVAALSPLMDHPAPALPPPSEALLGWLPEDIEGAIRIVVESRSPDGQWPSLSKARSRIKSSGGSFSNVTTDAVRAILDRAMLSVSSPS